MHEGRPGSGALRIGGVTPAVLSTPEGSRVLRSTRQRQTAVLDAKEALTWCYADRVLYEASSAPSEKENAREMVELIQTVSSLPDRNIINGFGRTTLQTWYCAAVLRAITYD